LLQQIPIFRRRLIPTQPVRDVPETRTSTSLLLEHQAGRRLTSLVGGARMFGELHEVQRGKGGS
jgi:hypothetical protein